MTLKSAPIKNPPLPPLSDQGVIEILHFLEHIMNQFESRYFAQIHRYYQHQNQPSLFADRTDTSSDQNSLPF